MKNKSKNIVNLIIYVLCMAFYIFGMVILYKMLFDLYYYFLFVTIPILFLFLTLALTTLFNIIINIIEININSRTDDEVIDHLNAFKEYVHRICKYVLIGIFMTLLTSLMLLDIVLCVNKSKYILLSISIVVWILLYYLLFTSIVKLIKKEIRI